MEYGVATFAQAPAMIETVITTITVARIVVAVAIFALATFIYFAIRSRVHRVDLEKAVRDFRSLDIVAFRNLVDPAEDTFLRDSLSPKKFRRIKRQRAWAAILYAREVGKAATALAKVGQVARRSPDAKVATSGVQLTENAFRLRLQTVDVTLRLLTGVLLPGLQSPTLRPVVEQYERAAETLFQVGEFSSS